MCRDCSNWRSYMNANEGVNTTTPTVSTNSDLGFATNSNYQNLANCWDFTQLIAKCHIYVKRFSVKNFVENRGVQFSQDQETSLWFGSRKQFTCRLNKKRRGVALYPLQLLPMVPLAASFSNGPNVFPLSVLILATGSLLVAFLSHHVTITLLSLSPNVSICASCESALVVLLRLILSPKVLPPSVEL